MLKTNKQIILNGNSIIDKQSVVSLSATIPNETGVSNVNQYIQNPELYEANKVEIRKDIQDFQNKVYEIEDELYTKEG